MFVPHYPPVHCSSAVSKSFALLIFCFTDHAGEFVVYCSSFKEVVAAASAEETAAKEANDAIAEKEEQVRSKGATDVLHPSPAPARGGRGNLLKKQPSQSVKDLLDTVGTPDMR